MMNRRRFLGAIRYPAAAALAGVALSSRGVSRARDAVADPAFVSKTPEQVAADESLWFEVQHAFTSDRSLVNLNNGGVCPTPAVALEAMKRHLEFSNSAPAYTMWRILEPRRETVRSRLARLFGCDPEEIAITRNASEGLEILQYGFDLKRGDEVLTTTQDYPRMITTWKQRERRDGIVLKQFPLPVPCEDPARVTSLFEEHITSKTRLILMCQVINLTGQVLPVRDVVRMARRRGIPVLVDGAHGFAHLTETRSDLDCDYYATSLHKWLLAPIGTGMLYVKRDRIRDLWPLMAAPDTMDDDIRKFEEIGTHPAANTLAIGEALTFHHGIGSERKLARLRYLRDYWARRLVVHDRIRLHTSLKPEFSGGIANVQIEGVDTAALNTYLWEKHRIFTVAIQHEDFEGLRISPNLYTTLDELDRFVDAMETVIRKGLPAA